MSQTQEYKIRCNGGCGKRRREEDVDIRIKSETGVRTGCIGTLLTFLISNFFQDERPVTG